MPKQKTIKTAICVDIMGSGFGARTSEMEIADHIEYYSGVFEGATLDWYRVTSIGTKTLQPGTELVLFDYGGMLPGNSLMEDNSSELIKWAQDNPNSLCLVVSDFTWRNAVRVEMDEMGLQLPNVINDDFKLEDPIPSWFRASVGVPYTGPEIQPRINPLAGMFKLGGTLPNIRFFEPRTKFIRWMVEQFGTKHVYDCGAGVGHVARELTNAGMRITALDINYREAEEFCVDIADATDYSFPSGSVVMLCRPCHGVFPHATIDQAILRGVSAIVYVGKTKNLKGDTGEWAAEFKKELTGAGADRENVWVMRP